jgi:hypothetical protein
VCRRRCADTVAHRAGRPRARSRGQIPETGGDVAGGKHTSRLDVYQEGGVPFEPSLDRSGITCLLGACPGNVVGLPITCPLIPALSAGQGLRLMRTDVEGVDPYVRFDAVKPVARRGRGEDRGPVFGGVVYDGHAVGTHSNVAVSNAEMPAWPGKLQDAPPWGHRAGNPPERAPNNV